MKRAVLYLAALAVLGWCLGSALLKTDTVTMSGHVWASCAELANRPAPAVSDEDGTALDGAASMDVTTTPGGCVGRFAISGVPERDRYTVAIGRISAPVPRGSVGTVELSGW